MSDVIDPIKFQLYVAATASARDGAALQLAMTFPWQLSERRSLKATIARLDAELATLAKIESWCS